MIRYREMCGFVGDEVAQHEIGREDESPVERQILLRGAVAPLGALAHEIQFSRRATQPLCGARELPLDFGAGLAAQPVFQCARGRRLRSAENPDFSPLKNHAI